MIPERLLHVTLNCNLCNRQLLHVCQHIHCDFPTVTNQHIALLVLENDGDRGTRGEIGGGGGVGPKMSQAL